MSKSLQTFEAESLRELMVEIEKYVYSNNLDVVHFSHSYANGTRWSNGEKYEALVLVVEKK